ncbi:TRAP transporter substrate-binding protein [Halalkalibacter oceani]|uniref:TRAP transporter substrate-binding protein n=1 Tax=Halalkalibacter oceani TaxID=1653776 RepID=UPI0033943BB3
MLKRLLTIFCFSLVILGGCSSGANTEQEGNGGEQASDNGTGSEETFVIRASNFFAETQTTGQALNKFAEEVAALSDGRVEVQAFHNAELGDHAESIEGTLSGAIEMTEAGNSGLDQFGVKGISITEMPYLFDDFDDFKTIMNNDEVRALMEEYIEAQGFKLIGYRYFGPRHTLANKPLRTIEDYQGVNLRAPEFDITVEMMKAWGATPTIIPLTEVYNAIQTGVADGFEGPFTTILSNQSYEVAKYVHLTNHIFYPGYLLMNKEYFDSLPADIQEVILEAGRISEEYQLELTEIEDEEGRAELEEHGVEIIEYSDLTPFQNAVQDMRVDLAEEMGPEAQELLNQIMDIKS